MFDWNKQVGTVDHEKRKVFQFKTNKQNQTKTPPTNFQVCFSGTSDNISEAPFYERCLLEVPF